MRSIWVPKFIYIINPLSREVIPDRSEATVIDANMFYIRLMYRVLSLRSTYEYVRIVPDSKLERELWEDILEEIIANNYPNWLPKKPKKQSESKVVMLHVCGPDNHNKQN